MSLASKLPWTHRFAGGFPGLSSQPLPTDADAIDYLSRMATADGAGVEVGVATAVDAFFAALKATPGLFDAIKASCILCGARTITGALVPLAGDAPTSNGFVSGDYSRTAGLTGDGTSYIDSGRASNADPQNDKHVSGYISTAAGSTSALLGVRSGGVANGDTLLILQDSSAAAPFRVNYAEDGNRGTRGTIGATGFIGATRTATSLVVSRILAEDEEIPNASYAAGGDSIYVFARNNGGTANFFSNVTLAFYSIGTSLSLEDLDITVSNLLTRMKFALLTGENPAPYDIDTLDYVVRGYENGGTLE